MKTMKTVNLYYSSLIFYCIILQNNSYLNNISKSKSTLKQINVLQSEVGESNNQIKLQSLNTASNHIKKLEKSIPSTSELINFALPTLGIWLLQPILSLIDTSVIGISKNSIIAEVAALGPGIAWIDSSTYLFQFMGMATTNLYAAALNNNNSNDVNDSNSTQKSDEVLSHALVTSMFFGFILLIIQYAFSNSVIKALSGSSTESIPYGIAYARIRAFAAPFAVPTIVGQSAFLAAKDSVTPFKAVLVGGFVNVVGDILLVTFLKKGLIIYMYYFLLLQFYIFKYFWLLSYTI
jgi:Na+-driven multidrug efflux pump